MKKSKNIGYTYEELDNVAREIAFISSGAFEAIHELMEDHRDFFCKNCLREKRVQLQQ